MLRDLLLNCGVIFKLDPDKVVPDPAWEHVIKDSNEALIIGGTQNITAANSLSLFKEIRERGFKGAVIQELTEHDAILPEANTYMLPVVLNSGEMWWIKDAHLHAIKLYGDLIPWEKIIPVGYLICNPKAAAAQKTRAVTPTISDAKAYLALAEHVFNLPVFYIEYSGTFGDKALVAALAAQRKKAALIYGGGIRSPREMSLMKPYADTLVIGNLIYEQPHVLAEITQEQ